MDLLFGFSGRIGRGRWWLAQGVVFMLLALLCGIFVWLASTSPRDTSLSEDLSRAGLPLLVVLVATLILMFWINAASTVKRYHDRNKSGWWYIVAFIPNIGLIWQFAECGFLRGTDRMNDYGPPGGPGRLPNSNAEFGFGGLASSSSRTQTVTSGPSHRAAPQGFGRR